MKILCVSDQIDPLVYSPSIKERFSDIDFVLCAGDLPLDYLEFIVSSLDKPLYFVFGNHDLKHFKRYKAHGARLPDQFYFDMTEEPGGGHDAYRRKNKTGRRSLDCRTRRFDAV